MSTTQGREDEPDAPDAPDGIGLVGEQRRLSHTNYLLDWIALADPKELPDKSVRLYWVLKSFIIEDKGQDIVERIVQITQEDLGEMLRCSVDTIQRSLKPLYKWGLVEDQERRKISTRVPGQKKPTITTLLIMKINEAHPPADYTGWLTPFTARKDVRARRAARKAAKKSADADETAGQTDTADVRHHSDQDIVDNPADETSTGATKPVVPGDNSPELPLDDVSAGQCDTANLPETGADLPENGADLRPIGSNHAGSNPLATGGRNAAPQTPAYRSTGHPAYLVTDQLEFESNHLGETAKNGDKRLEPRRGINWSMWGIPELRQELDRRFDQELYVVGSPGNVQVIREIHCELKARGVPHDEECLVQLPDPSDLAAEENNQGRPVRRRSPRTRNGDRKPRSEGKRKVG